VPLCHHDLILSFPTDYNDWESDLDVAAIRDRVFAGLPQLIEDLAHRYVGLRVLKHRLKFDYSDGRDDQDQRDHDGHLEQ